MELNTTTALLTAVISAGIGFGLAFYLERQINASMQTKFQKTFVTIAMISFGYGLMATLNEVIGFPLQGLRIRYDKLVVYVLVNILILPIILLTFAKLLVLKTKPENFNLAMKSDIAAGSQLKYLLMFIGALSVVYLVYIGQDKIFTQSVPTYDMFTRTDLKNCNSPYNAIPYSMQFTFNKNENKIIVTTEEVKNGVSKKRIESMGECVILDAKNWSCNIGGTSWKYALVKGELYFDQEAAVNKICPVKIVKR